MTNTTRSATPQQQIAILKHLAGGKDFDTVAEILNLPRDHVVNFARTHGYPDADKMLWAVDVLAKKLATAENALPAGRPQPSGVRLVSQSPAPTMPSPAAAKPDEIRLFLNAAKAHPSKRIQAAADRVFDQLDRLRGLIREDQDKNAEKRAAAAAKERARAEVKRLEAELATARARLRADKPARPVSTPVGEDTPAKIVREWATAEGIACPAHGKIPNTVRTAYHAAHQDGAA